MGESNGDRDNHWSDSQLWVWAVRISSVGVAAVGISTFLGSYAKQSDFDRINREGTHYCQRVSDRVDRLREDLISRTADRVFRSEWLQHNEREQRENAILEREIKRLDDRIAKQWDRINGNSLKIEGAHGSGSKP